MLPEGGRFVSSLDAVKPNDVVVWRGTRKTDTAVG
ncbi:MAG: hypothetical protein FD119_108 [Stygiobacter sp.]|nr:MAG: hypothetical protein FD119_108 [Stygiobacter sp.]